MGLFKRKPAKSPVRQRQDAMSRRQFFAKVGNAAKVAGAAGVAGVAGKIAVEGARTIGAIRQRNASAHALKATEFRTAKISNPEKWVHLSEIYKLNPLNNPKDRAMVDAINQVAAKTGLTPERTLITIEQNPLSDSQIRALETSKKGESPAGIERRTRIIRVIREMQKIEGHPEMERRIRSTRGSLNRVRNFESTQR